MRRNRFWKDELGKLFFCMIFAFCVRFQFLNSASIGSDTDVSRKGNTYICTSESGVGDQDNKIHGFVALEGGITIPDSDTTCTYTGFLPISGSMDFNGGSFYLLKDLTFARPLDFTSVGRIYGNGHVINFAASVDEITFPDTGDVVLFNPTDIKNLGNDINSISWSYDNAYVAVAIDNVGDNHEIKVYYFSGTSLTLTASVDIGVGGGIAVNSVAWHPTSHYLASGKQNGGTADDLNIFYLNVSNGTFSQKFGLEVGRDVNALAWRPQGDYLVTSTDGAHEVVLYEFSGGTLIWRDEDDFAGNRTVQLDAISWKSTGDYFAVGLNDANPQLALYYFDSVAQTITYTLGIDAGDAVTAVSWRPTSGFVAVGLDGSATRLRIYEHNVSNGTLTLRKSLNESEIVYSVDWNSDGTKLLVSRATGSGTEVRIYDFNNVTYDLTIASAQDNSQNVYSSRWSPNDSYIATGDEVGRLVVYKARSGLSFDNVKLFFDVNVTFKGPVSFSNTCLLNAKGNDIIFQEDGSLGVKPNSELEVLNANLECDKRGIFNVEGNNSKIKFSNSEIRMHSDIVFGNGTLVVNGDVDLSGAYTFYYQSDFSSTVTVHSNFTVRDSAVLSMGRTSTESYQPFEFIDNTSHLNIDDATLNITSTGAQFTKGRINLSRTAVFDIDSSITSYGLIIGDGTAASDMEIRVKPGSEFNLSSGVMTVNDYAVDKLLFDSYAGRVSLKEGCKLYFQRPIDIIKGEMFFENFNTLSFAPNQYVTFNQTRLTSTGNAYESKITGTFYDLETIILGDDDTFLVLRGESTQNINVSGERIWIGGDGDFSGQISLSKSNANFRWNLDCILKNDLLLNGGKIILNKDMVIANSKDITPSGTVDLRYSIIQTGNLAHAMTGTIYFDGSESGGIRLNSNVALSSALTFSKNCTIYGRGHKIQLGNSGAIVVEKGSILTLHNVNLDSVQGNNIRCLDNESKIVLDNSTLHLHGDYIFDVGAFEFKNNVNIIGGYTFTYESAMTSTICCDATLKLERGAKLSIGRKTALSSNEPLDLKSNDSTFILDNATLNVTSFGMCLKKGNFLINSKSFLDIDSLNPSYGFRLGDGTSAGDIGVELSGGSILDIRNGILVYDNTNTNSFYFSGNAGELLIEQNGKFYLSRSLLLTGGIVDVFNSDSIQFDNGVTLSSSKTRYKIGTNLVYDLTGGQTVLSAIKLSNNDDLRVVQGNLFSEIYVQSGNPLIDGTGVISRSIIVRDHTVTVTIGLQSSLDSNIFLNGGTIFLSDDLKFSDDKVITGSGTIRFNGKSLNWGGKDFTLTSSLIFDNAGDEVLNAKTSWTTTHTFNGISNLQGNGNVLEFSSTGGIFVNNDATLYMTDVVLKGLRANKQLLLGNNNSQVRMSNVAIVLDNNFSTTSGNIYVEGPTVFALKNYNWTFDQLGSLSVNGITLWKDSLDEVNGGDVLFGSLQSQHLSLLNSGTIKEAVNNDYLSIDLSTLEQGIIDLQSRVIGDDLPDASGDVVLDGKQLNNFGIHSSLSLSLTLSNGARVVQGNSDIELKTTDTIYVIGRNNIFDVSGTVSINGTLSFAEGSELTFEFNDRGDNPLVCISVDLSLLPDSILAFKNEGVAAFKDRIIISFNGIQQLNKPMLTFQKAARGIICEKMVGHAESIVTFIGKGIVDIDSGGEFFVGELRHLIIGGNSDSYDFNILIDDNGAFKSEGAGAKISIHRTNCSLDIEQGGNLFVGNGAVFEINSLNETASPGWLSDWDFEKDGVLSIDNGGRIIIGANNTGLSTSWNNEGGEIRGYGVIQLLGEASFVGRIPLDRRFATSGLSAQQLVSLLLQRHSVFSVSTLFEDLAGNNKVRFSNGTVVQLEAGDSCISDGLVGAEAFVDGSSGGRSFRINDSGVRVES